MSRQSARIVFHLDMDHFYTAVEERRRPDVRGKPVVVGADPKEGKGRGVVQTANYEARKFGIRSGMPISKAWKLNHQAVFLLPDFDLYIKTSNEIMDIARKYADKFEQWGIDEAFLDVGSKAKDYNEAETLGRQLKKEILEKEGLTCSIGVGPNKLVAKIASDFQKPDGLTVVRKEAVDKFLAPLPVRKLLWVGRKTEQKLAEMNVKTIGDLARFDPSVLVERFGVVGHGLFAMAHGIDNSPVEERTGVKSIGRETTFEEDTTDCASVLAASDRLAEDIHREVIERRLLFKTVTVKIRYENFETHTYSRSLSLMTDQIRDLKKMAKELLMHYLKTDRKVRLIGVRVSGFTSGEKQRTLA